MGYGHKSYNNSSVGFLSENISKEENARETHAEKKYDWTKATNPITGDESRPYLVPLSTLSGADNADVTKSQFTKEQNFLRLQQELQGLI